MRKQAAITFADVTMRFGAALLLAAFAGLALAMGPPNCAQCILNLNIDVV